MKNRQGNEKTASIGKRFLIVLISAIIAVALVVTCALVIDTSKPVDVNNGAGGDVATSTAHTNLRDNLTGRINNGDTITWSTVTNYSFQLPAGTYTLEVWGAQGASTSGKAGGLGAYAKGTLTITALTQMYVYVGGQGSGTSGGYNGGGSGGSGSRSNSGGGGGGATDFRRGGTAYSNRILVAGGGGGAGGPGQGGSSGGTISSGTGGTPGYGGAGAGSGGSTGTANGGTSDGRGGAGGQTNGGGGGGASATGSSSGNDGTYYPGGGGGGGGGYYGGGGGGGAGRYGANNNVRGSSGGSGGLGYGGSGGAGASSARGYYSGAGGGGGGGSSYIGGVTSGSWSGNNHSGSGMARITVNSVNQAPQQRGVYSGTSVYGTASKARMRSGAGITVTPANIAVDPENTTMYFTDGTASNLDTCTTGQTGLWINSSCTTLATNYITWSRTSSAISITAIHRYPRANVDNAPANGKLRLWTKVRDSYGSNTKRGWSIIYFDLNVSQSDLTIINTSNNTSGTDVTNKGTYVEYSYGSGDSAYHYRLGNSDPQGTTYDYLTNGHIYNTASGRPTVFIPEPLTTNRTAGFTVNAADLYRDADTIHDVVGIKSVATDSANSKYYTISYNADSASYGSSGLYKSITIKPTSVRPPNAVYVAVQITAQSCEKNGSTTGNGSKAIIGGTNTSLWLVFKIANTRPYYASSSVINTGIANEPTAIMDVGAYKEIKISDFLKDTDGNVPTFVTSAGSVKLPTNEYASVSRENAVLALKSTSNYYANHNKTVANSWQTGEGSVATGFAGKDRVIAQAGSSAATNACVTYSFPNSNTIRFTARAATQYLYRTDNRVGDFYVLVKVLDPGDSGDTGIWYPIAIKVNSSTPSSPATTANFTLGFNAATTDEGTPINISPVSYTEDGMLYGVGAPAPGSATSAGRQAYPFVTDADVFSYGNGLDGTAYTSELNEIVMLDTGSNTDNNDAGKAARKAAALTLYGTEPFFNVEIIDLWAREKVFANLNNTQLNNLHIVSDGQNTKKFYGLKITPLRSTSNYYFRIDVKVVDSHGTKATVPIEINVENNAVSLRRDTSESSDTRFPFNKTDCGSYVSESSSSTGDAYIAYTIEQGDALYLTPYDFAYDFDMPAGLNENGTFNTNPSFDTGYSAAATAITKPYRVKRTPSPTAGGSALAETEVTLQPLTFANESSIISAASAYSTYFSTDVTRADDAAGVHAIRFTAKSRTSSTNIVRFTVTDGFSSVNFAVVIKVSNTAPRLQRNTDILTLAASEVRYNNEIMPSTRAITLDGYVVDINNDTGMFFEAGSARVVAYDASAVAPSVEVTNDDYKYFTALNYNGTTKKYVGSDDGAYVLSDYVGVEILRIGGVDQIRVTAKSSTQLFDLPLYVEFTVNDDYREQPGRATLRIRVQVLNSDPRLVTDDLAEEKFSPAGVSEELTRYVWDIKYNNAAEKSLTRYLVNCRELYESSAIQGLQSNKLLLFDEADGKQYTLLNTYNTELSGTFVNNLAVRYSAKGTTVTPDAGEYITADAFRQAEYQNAAVLYTRTYALSSSVTNRDLSVEVIYYEYTGSGSSRKLTAVKEKNRVTDYWAIAIKDKSNAPTETGVPTQIAIAVKDNHYSPTGASEANRIPVYTASVADGAVVTETGVCNTSDMTVLNFYLRNQAPGLMDMHKQYRTDGNSESQTPVSETNSDYTVKLENLHGYQFVGENKPSDQRDLASAAFTDDFKYQYYVNVRESTGSDNPATLVSKAYPGDKNSAFYYKAVQVPSTGTVNMPISYIAMPNGYSSSSGTIGTSSVHVTFANAGGDSAALKDAEYLSWKDNSNARALIMQNLTLTDGTNTWSGTTINSNPYIQIEYVSDDKMLGIEPKNSYVNHYRGVLSTDNKFSPDDAWKDENGASKFREDKFGFAFTKRSDSEAKRPSGALKLTVGLKTYVEGGSKNSAPQDISVDIEVENSVMADIKYNTSSFADRATIDIKTHVGAADTTIALDRNGGQNTISYKDADTNDTARFFMPSASAVRLGDVMSSSEISAMMSNSLYDGSYSAFFESKGVALSAEQVAAFVPNKDYTNYFTVTPSNGSSSSVTFKPLAKTQLNISSDVSDTVLWDNYHLKKDNNGDMYYPFKVVFYDDIDSSGSFARGKYMTVVFKVYIGNSPISSSLDGKEGDYFKTNLTLVKGAANTVDVSTILTDSDIPLNAAQSMMVQSEWNNLSPKDKLTKDYLIMPVKTGGLPDYSRYGSSSQTALPIDITYAENSNTTIKFSAASAFTTPSTGIPLLFKFKDSVQTEVGILFYINYVNEAPTVNEDTYGGARTLNIFMKTGDSFTIYASDASKYETDKQGEFKSPDEFDRLIASTGSDKITYPKAENGKYVNAQTMRSSFELLTRDNYDARVNELNRPNGIIGDLGSLVLGDDDAPSTLRFISTRISGGVTVGSFSGTGIFDVTPGNFVKTEDALKNNGSLTQPMSVKITAGGVGTSVYTATLTDGSNEVNVVLNLTVLSTPPAIKTTGLPAGLVLSDDNNFDYEITLDYGAHAEFALRSFVTDKDRNDDRTFDVADSYDGEKFKVINPEGVSAISVSRTQIENGATNAFYIEATDYIPEEGKYSEVYFRVTDAHDSQSDEIRIKVNIAPRDLEVKSGTQTNAYAISLDSYAEYLASGRALTVDLVGGTSGSRIYYDPDVNAPSALYDVAVYAMYSFSEGNRTPASAEDVLSSEDYLVISRTQARRGVTDSSAVTTLGSNSAAKYIRHFFEITIADDGKTMTLVPVSSTVSGGTSRLPEALNLYVVVDKAYKTENGDYTMSAVGGTAVGSDNTVGAYVNVAVGNSAPVAVQSTALNFGYPYAGEGENAAARDYDFLFFAGSAGDSLTWNLYDTENEQRGLFYDHDMRNYIQAGKGENADANLPSTNETLTYAGNTILASYTYTDSNGDNVSVSTVRDAIDGGSHGPVLSITESNGKVTIKINRKVAITQPSEDNRISPYSDVPVEISCIDTLGRRQDNQTEYRRRTVIIVRVENDPPEFKKEVTRNDYRVTYSNESGYELSASVATGKTLTVKFSDILDDADVDMDAYFLYAPDSSCIKDSTTTLGSGTVPLFDVALKNSRNTFGIITLSSLEFTCTSVARGEVATGALMLYDSTRLDNAHTSKLTIRLTVGNTAPTAISRDPVVISVMGIPIPVSSDSEDETEEVSGVALTENVIKYMTDINPNDAVNAAEYNAGKEVTDPTRSYTYMYVKDIEVYTTDADMTDLRPDMFGPGTELKQPEPGEDPPAPITKVCDVGWADSDMDTHQSFSIMLTPGVYGTQHVRLYVRDDGYLDGAMNMVSDGITVPLDITIIVSRPIADMQINTFSIANRVTRTMTADVLLNSESQPDNARGYSIKSISAPEGGALTVTSSASVQASAYDASASADETEWRITANYETEAGEMTVLFDAGGIDVEQKFNVTVTRNNAPVMKPIDSMGIFTEGQLNDQHMIVIRPDRWFEDPDLGDVMRFNDAKVKVGAYATAHIENGNIVLIFKGRGTTQLTFNITDATGNLYSHSIEIGCTDMAELSTWNKIVATIQSNVLMYSLIGAGVLLLIILLIIILVVVHKRRKMRREIEALLDSESELEEEMLRLSAGAPQYQSFGYLPPTTQTMNNPNLMIGSAADNPTPNSLQLGAGTGQTAGVAPDGGTTQQLPPQQSRPGMPQQSRPGMPQQQPRQNTVALNGQPMPQQSRPGMPQQQQPRPNTVAPNGQPMPQQSRPGMPQQQPRQNTGAPQGGQPQNRDGFNPNDF